MTLSPRLWLWRKNKLEVVLFFVFFYQNFMETVWSTGYCVIWMSDHQIYKTCGWVWLRSELHWWSYSTRVKEEEILVKDATVNFLLILSFLVSRKHLEYCNFSFPWKTLAEWPARNSISFPWKEAESSQLC